MIPQEEPHSIRISAIKIEQPIGTFYIGVIDSKTLCEITWFDIRRMLGEREFETYLGIQRPLIARRIKEIKQYVGTMDACFPTSVILAVPSICARYDEDARVMTLSNYLGVEGEDEPVFFRQMAKILDGQHRIEGLKDYNGPPFEINVSIFVDIDIAEQAYIFSTVNLAQTKVNKSLVYDLFDLAKSRSPQKLCHNIAVALDQTEGSPFYRRIKRLGVATEGRFHETITQATFVGALMPYISNDEIADRDIYRRGKTPPRADTEDADKLIFRNMMIDKRDMDLVDILWNFFSAVRNRWPTAWEYGGRGVILNKTNGFRGLMRFLRNAHLHVAGIGDIPEVEDFYHVLERIDLDDMDFTVDNYKPGTSGESALYWTLVEKSGIE